MIVTVESLRKRREEIMDIAKRYRAENIRIFGSVARNEAREYSDIDLLVTFQPGASLLD